MGRVGELLAAICHACPLCRGARRRPASLIGRLLAHPLHADHCPLWKAERERYGPPELGGGGAEGERLDEG